MLPRSSFLFILCQAGAEPVLKEEISRIHPDLRFAYSRPGFVTFKNSRNPDGGFGADFELGSVFARAYGVSLGKAPTDQLDPVVELARKLGQGKRVRLHVAERERYEPGSEPRDHAPDARADAYRERLLAASPDLFEIDPRAQAGELVLDVVLVEENEAWLGAHVHAGDHSPEAGGKPRIFLPAQSPSRAFLKLEEAVLWSGAPIRRGEVAVEIGSAPGGASLAMLNRGLEVYGIDRAEMDPLVYGNPSFHRVGTSVFETLRADFPDDVHWLMMDMNAEPAVSLQAVERLVPGFEDTLLGMLLTIKLNDWKLATGIPVHLARIRALGMQVVRARQLANNRREYTIYALTARGKARA